MFAALINPKAFEVIYSICVYVVTTGKRKMLKMLVTGIYNIKVINKLIFSNQKGVRGRPDKI